MPPEGVPMSEVETRCVPVDEIEIFASQSRETFDESELIDLAENIKVNGLLQPGLAWFDEGRGQLILVCGERRLRALKLAGKTMMELKIIRGKRTQAQLLAMNIAENLQRSSLNPIERANAFRRLMQLEDITAREVALRLHVSDATVSRDLLLLDLTPELQAKVACGDLPSSVASSLARLADQETCRFLSEQYAIGALSRDGVAREVSQRLGRKGQGKPRPSRLSFKLEGGIAVTVSASQTPTPDILTKLCEHLKREAKNLEAAATRAIPLHAS